MEKRSMYYLGISVVVFLLSFTIKPSGYVKRTTQTLSGDETQFHSFPSLQMVDYLDFRIPFTGKSFTGFKEAVGFKESQGRYKIINSFGYLGKYQFGIDALRAIGINNTAAFLNNPDLQEIAFRVLLSKNKSELKEEIEAYEGKVINGILITESGILAAAHLGGAGSVRKYLKSNGKREFKDGYGTTLNVYLKKFGGYDTSSIIEDSKAKVCLK